MPPNTLQTEEILDKMFKIVPIVSDQITVLFGPLAAHEVYFVSLHAALPLS